MSARKLGEFVVESPEWHAARANGIGGSEIAAILGLSPYQSMFSLFHYKKGLIPEQDVNAQMSWGTRLEPVIAAKFLEDHPEYVAQRGATYCHDERTWQIANPDLVLGAPQAEPTSLLEIKTAKWPDDWGPSGSDEIPVGYRCQVLWYLDVMGFTQAHVAVLIAGSDYREYVITADPAEIAILREAGEDFMRRLELDDRPDIDEHSATYQAVRHLHPEIDGTDVDLDPDLVRDYCTARANLAAAEAAESRTKSLVLDAIGTAKRGMYAGKTIARRQAKGDGTPYLVACNNLPNFEQETAA